MKIQFPMSVFSQNITISKISKVLCHVTYAVVNTFYYAQQKVNRLFKLQAITIIQLPLCLLFSQKKLPSLQMRTEHAALSINTMCLWDSGENQLWKHFQLQHSFTGINWTCLCTYGKCRQIMYFVDLGFILFIFFPLSCVNVLLFLEITSKQNRREGSFLLVKIENNIKI